MSLKLSKLLFLFAGLIIAACQPKKENSVTAEFNIDGALLAMNLAEGIEKGQPIDNLQWEQLFETEGYNSYLCSGNENFKKNMIKDAFYLVFDPSKQQQLDSVLALPIEFNENTQRNLLIHNFSKWKNDFKLVNDFIRSTDFSDVLMEAHTLTKSFLPEEIKTESVELFPVQIIAMDPDAYVTGCGLVMDLNIAATMGKEELVKTIAHEYHHNYRQQVARSFQEPAMLEIDRLHREGLADLIDKEEPPISNMMGSEFMIEYYNADYSDTPKKLKEFESLTVAYLEEKLEPSDFSEKISGFFSFGGHPNGYYMTLLIRQVFGIQPLIDSFADPATFLLLYNEAAAQIEAEHVFSQTFMDFVKEQKKIAETKPEYSDESFRVTIRVNTPDNTNEVYIAGNQSELGDWDPGKSKLNQINDNQYEISISLKSPAEFKFTRGTWDTEGYVKGQLRGPNTRLGFATDTLVTYEIDAWIDDPTD